MLEAYKKMWQNYATFDGRSRRSDYWYVVLANIIIGIIIGPISGFIPSLSYTFGNISYSYLGFIYSLVTFIPGLALTVRRLHDTGKSGWYILMNLIPLVGWIFVLIKLVSDSEPDNEYGANPKVQA